MSAQRKEAIGSPSDPGANDGGGVTADELTTGGAPLAPTTRTFFEQRLGQPLAAVRLHQGAAAERVASSFGALALTYGSHVWLGHGERATPSYVLAHELAHVVQQQRGPASVQRLGAPAREATAEDREELGREREAYLRRREAFIGSLRPQRPEQRASSGGIEVDVMGREIASTSGDRPADVGYLQRALRSRGVDIVVDSIRGMIAQLRELTAGGRCIRTLRIWNHGGPHGQVATGRSYFGAYWLDDASNREHLDALRSMFCCNANMEWYGCSVAGMDTDATRAASHDPSTPGHRYAYPDVDTAAAAGDALTGVRFGTDNMARWADATCATVSGANWVYYPLRDRIREGGGRVTIRPSTGSGCACGPGGTMTAPACRPMSAEEANALIEATRNHITRAVTFLGQLHSLHAQPYSPALLRTADTAVRQELGALIGPGAGRARRHVHITSTADFGRIRAPSTDVALLRIGEVALREAATSATADRRDVLERACITTADNVTLRTMIAQPILTSLGLATIQRYEALHRGGQTTMPTPGVPRTIDLPDTARNFGHVLVHELIHFYGHDDFYAYAAATSRDRDLREGAAEFLARHVINQRLAGNPDFVIQTSTYADEFRLIASIVRGMGFDAFARAYFTSGATYMLPDL